MLQPIGATSPGCATCRVISASRSPTWKPGRSAALRGARERLSGAAASRRYTARMRDLPRYFGEQIANMEAGLKRGFTPPAVTLKGRDASVAAFLKAPPENAFFPALCAPP